MIPNRALLVLIAAVIAAGSTLAGCGEPEEVWNGQRWPEPFPIGSDESPAQWTVKVLETLPHDPEAFTQGLERLSNGQLIESLGLWAVSEIRIVAPASGDTVRSAALPDDVFGEGLTVVGSEAVQLTWRAGVAYRWSLPDLTPLPSWTFEGEGWGLCADREGFVMSDGSHVLTRRSFEDFSVQETLPVRRDASPVQLLNELECVDDLVVANVWRSTEIVVIDSTGTVVASIDASPLLGLVAVGDPVEDVLNGIAAEPDGTFLLTGKRWPSMFRVAVVVADP